MRSRRDSGQDAIDAFDRKYHEADGPPGFTDSLKKYYAGDPLETEHGIFDDQDMNRLDDTNDDDDQPSMTRDKVRVTCPDCGTAFRVALPQGIHLAQDDEEESEGSRRMIRTTCRACKTSMSILPPAGTRFAPLRGGQEALRVFRRVYKGQDLADTTDALSAFRESYGRATAYQREITRFRSR